MNLHTEPYIIGIAGGSSSGKTSILNAIREKFTIEEVCIISQDDFYKPLNQQQKDEKGIENYDLPTAIDEARFINDVKTLMAGNEIKITEYVFNNPNKNPEQISLFPAPVIVVEGLFIFYFEKINQLLNLKIFVDARDDIKFMRRLNRDENERGIPADMILHQWHNHVWPAYRRYLLPFRDESDIIITNNYSYDKGVEIIANHIAAKLR